MDTQISRGGGTPHWHMSGQGERLAGIAIFGFSHAIGHSRGTWDGTKGLERLEIKGEILFLRASRAGRLLPITFFKNTIKFS
jgi:hypothetical protein